MYRHNRDNRHTFSNSCFEFFAFVGILANAINASGGGGIWGF